MDDSQNNNSNERTIQRIPVERIQKWLDDVRAVGEAGDPDWTDEVAARVAYVEGVILHGNAGGRCNPTMDLPVPWTLGEICSVLGASAPPEPGSAAAWRRVRGHYDALYLGAAAGGGR